MGSKGARQPLAGADLATDFDLDDPDALTASIEKATVAFIDDIERFLAEHGFLEQAGPRD